MKSLAALLLALGAVHKVTSAALSTDAVSMNKNEALTIHTPHSYPHGRPTPFALQIPPPPPPSAATATASSTTKERDYLGNRNTGAVYTVPTSTLITVRNASPPAESSTTVSRMSPVPCAPDGHMLHGHCVTRDPQPTNTHTKISIHY